MESRPNRRLESSRKWFTSIYLTDFCVLSIPACFRRSISLPAPPSLLNCFPRLQSTSERINQRRYSSLMQHFNRRRRFTARMKIQGGSNAVSRYGVMAFLDIGSLRTFITAEAWTQTKARGAAANACERYAGPCYCGGFEQFASSSRLNLRPVQHTILPWRLLFRRIFSVGVHRPMQSCATPCPTWTRKLGIPRTGSVH